MGDQKLYRKFDKKNITTIITVVDVLDVVDYTNVYAELDLNSSGLDHVPTLCNFLQPSCCESSV